MTAMKLLLDENIPHGLRQSLTPPHDVFTVSYLGWNGVENGKLLLLAAANGFDALITTDRGMEYEQNSASLPSSVFVLIAPTNTVDDLRALVPKLLSSIASSQPNAFVKVQR